ncbi:MAG TPA: S41 family peptidase [Gemmataceae bacterium]|nr:S41 family peptidase [Gemmataceae bacterium]
MHRSPWLAGPVFLVVFATGLLLGWSGLLPNPLSGQPARVQHTFTPFWEAWRLVEDNYVDRQAVKPRPMTEGAIRGMLDSLGDTGHTTYLTPEEARRMEDDLKGHMEGIGVRIGERQGRPTALAVLPGTPAEKGGVKPGDVLLQADGKDLKGKSPEQIVEMVTGKAGTELTLTVSRAGESQPLTLTLTRAHITVPDVGWHMLQGRPVAHLSILSFGEKVDEQLRTALDEARKAGARGLVLDVRLNPGGLKDQAVAVTSEFLKDGNVFIEQDAQGKQTPLPVKPGGTATDVPLVVLIDEGTASSAEIFAGAIQDHHRGKLVGTKTFGTGTVLQPFELSDHSAVLLAVSEWLTPDGRQIWHKGITPDVPVALPSGAAVILPEESGRMSRADLDKSSDKQLLRALEVLGEQIK